MKLLAKTWHKLLPITLGIGISRHFLYSEIQIRSMKWVCAGLRDLEKTKTGMTTQGPATLHFFSPKTTTYLLSPQAESNRTLFQVGC